MPRNSLTNNNYTELMVAIKPQFAKLVRLISVVCYVDYSLILNQLSHGEGQSK